MASTKDLGIWPVLMSEKVLVLELPSVKCVVTPQIVVFTPISTVVSNFSTMSKESVTIPISAVTTFDGIYRKVALSSSDRCVEWFDGIIGAFLF